MIMQQKILWPILKKTLLVTNMISSNVIVWKMIKTILTLTEIKKVIEHGPD